MNYINFLHILFCLFLHVSILYPSEREGTTSHWKKIKACKDYKDQLVEETIEQRKDTGATWQTLHDSPASHTLLAEPYLSQNQLNKKSQKPTAKFFPKKNTIISSIEKILRTSSDSKKNDLAIVPLLKYRTSPRKDAEQDSSD